MSIISSRGTRARLARCLRTSMAAVAGDGKITGATGDLYSEMAARLRPSSDLISACFLSSQTFAGARWRFRLGLAGGCGRFVVFFSICRRICMIRIPVANGDIDSSISCRAMLQHHAPHPRIQLSPNPHHCSLVSLKIHGAGMAETDWHISAGFHVSCSCYDGEPSNDTRSSCQLDEL